MMSSRKVRGGAALLGAALLTGGLVAGPADAKTNAPTGTANAAAACKQAVGAVTASGAVAGFGVSAGSPPTRTAGGEVPGLYPAGTAKLSGSFTTVPTAQATLEHRGYLVLGSSMYTSYWTLGADGKLDPDSVALYKVGGGWDTYNAFVDSAYSPESGSTKGRLTHYGLRKDGMLFRWTIQNGYWMYVKSAGGFASVKTMTLISQTATYDSFLALTRGGALYTIRVPLTAPLKPVVKKVRASTWGAFDQLIATRCGKEGTLLLAIDKDLQVAYLYAVGHANGAATVIQGLGRVTGGVFNAPVYFRNVSDPGVDPPLNGE
jgi:hypothetical protein